MLADVVVGNNIDTPSWIAELQVIGAENIIVIDFEYSGEPEFRKKVLYISATDAKKYLRKFESVCFYKTMCAYPGMGGKMSTLYKK
ncbi:hypothetical protein [Planococcus salinus]|uniref:Uncharacterized protein n=1 Tax=Planococcus salinus TaxID=1848460 RepID=A0A3M8P994_9BACL|nr:hypothetical protein [Planococcus salinus]RNF39754.1 hypothetical protein EEX84_07245 [Planococcus salinus]